jgi:ppGpp synthetase/RelA/SpoT-type nucleotidyltranferase
MQLSRMQDIGGCRAVVSSVEAVGELVDYYTTKSRIKHKLVRRYPYITEPKASGYQRHPSHGARSSVCSV